MGPGPGAAVSCGVGRRHGLDPALLWLWHWPAAIAPIGPLAWDPPYAVGMAPKRQNKEEEDGSSRHGAMVNESD